ncbi:hypothetical protein HUE58_04960 [Candidatus Ruthia endofausta]|uniref:Uncharacterized protein n=1 Tax=Candidatus Ruthia endofausta TaxID=2738852 RepID=A0A6N0HPZ9_9GAMM|nr:hypothetical protein [Candidatus Ruthia endofausta]QKQ24469.1 hypothetical protein HUE58_04960 [Candidatus Ruthia endofausta]
MAQVNVGRRKLLTVLLNNSDKLDLGIEEYPVEKNMYKATLENSGIHREIKGGWKIVPPKDSIYLKVWSIIEDFFKNAKEEAQNFLL